MRFVSSLILFSIIITFNSFGQNKKIWRSIPIDGGQTLQLAGSIDSLTDVSYLVKKNTYTLKPGTFGGADSIVIITNNQKIIKELQFHYGSEHNFEEFVKAVEMTIGKPKLVESKKRSKAIWKDDSTLFILLRNKKGDYSIIRDR